MTKHKVAVVGAGHGKFGKRADASIRELAFESATQAYEDAGVDPKTDIDASVVTLAGDQFNGQGAPAAVINDAVGHPHVPTLRVEAACASGTAGIRTAYGWVAAGLYDVVAVIGVEQMTRLETPVTTELMSRAGDLRWEFPFGISFPSFYALYASAHMAEFGTTREQLSMVGVKNHHYGAKNPKAHLRKEVSLEEAVNAFIVAYPLNLYDCSLISDGSATLILANAEKAKKMTDTPIWITGVGSGGSQNMLSDRPHLFGLEGAVRAGKIAYKMAKVEPKDIDFAELHDCFTIAEIMAYEDLGFCKKGEGGKFIEDQESYIGGKLPANVDGGLKSKGHPVGCTGVSQGYEITKQLRGEADEGRQVPNATRGLCHNVGQSGQFVNVIIYERD
ncbi:MAG: thiolase domain-containing protein [Candidatus Hodarchaeota archaeon]